MNPAVSTEGARRLHPVEGGMTMVVVWTVWLPRLLVLRPPHLLQRRLLHLRHRGPVEAHPGQRDGGVGPEGAVQPRHRAHVHEGLHAHEGAEVGEGRGDGGARGAVLQREQLAQQQPAHRLHARTEAAQIFLVSDKYLSYGM